MFDKNEIYLNVEAKNYEELFLKMSNIFIEKKYVTSNYLQSLLKREKEYPTGFSFDGYNIALPHTDAEYILEKKIVLVRLKNEIDYKEVVTNNDIKVKIFIMLLIKNPSDQVDVLEKLIKIISDKTFYNNVMSAENVNEIKINDEE